MRPPTTRPAPVLALAGPTASGKSAAAMALARRCAAQGRPLEIISVDSALVYRGMDIGTAKPSAAEQAEVPHHLIDLIEPTDAYSAARFVADAQAAIDSIRARGALPLLVGGTMLYLKALRDGLSAMPPADAAVRAELDARAATLGWPALHAELARVDPATAARLSPGDSQRIQRALEVWTISGRPLSSWHAEDGLGRANEPAESPPRGTPLHLLALEPTSRAWLHERIALRFDAMLADGLVDELRRLRARGDLYPNLPSMRCVGYRQTWEALEACEQAHGPARRASPGDASTRPPCLEDDPAAIHQLREAAIAATRQLAKRQLTWLRSMPERHVIPCDAEDACNRVIHAALQALDDPAPAPG